jgi:ubiquinol-cytochrome c reductase cytochrome b/c1 subunit
VIRPATATNNLGDTSLARDVGLFLVLVVLINGLVLPGSASPGDLRATFYLAFFIHAGFTLYGGRVNAVRTATWLFLVVAWAGSEIAGFFGYLIPSGQLMFWFASQLAALPIIGETLAPPYARMAEWMHEAPALGPVLLLCLLSLDLAAGHRDDWRKRSPLQIGVFLAAVVAGAVVLALVGGTFIGLPGPSGPDIGALPTPAKIIPSWYELPFYALLRAVPAKLAGVVVMFAAMLVPIVWPWMRADLLRTGPMRSMWLLLCLALAAIWIGLGWLGSRPPDPLSIDAAQALAVFYFAFFLFWPPLFHGIARKGSPLRAP